MIQRINDMPSNIEGKVANELVTKHFALQVDESTHISGKAHLLHFAQFIYQQK